MIPTPLRSDAGPRGGTTGYGLRDWTAALLPTPVASDHHNPPSPDRADERAASMVRGVKLSEHVLRSQLLKTPTAQLAVNGGSQHPAKRAEGRHGPTLADEVEHLLPTPTATPYGSNQSPSPGAAVRPSLDTLAPTLLPTPSAADGSGGHMTRSGDRATELLLPGIARALAGGDRTGPPSDDGRLF